MSRELLQLARDAIRSLMTGRDFAVGQTGHYLNIISRIETELNRPQPEFDTPESHVVKWSIPVDPNNFGEPLAQPEQEPAHPNPAAKHWHDLYRAKCKDFQDQQARLGAEIVALEEEIAELKEEQPEQQFYPDWDMLKPYHERIAELEAQLAKTEQEHKIPTKIFGPNLEEILNAAGFYKPEQETYVYAKRLAEFIWEKHFQKESPDWKPLENTLGVLTQIDNMTCVLEKAKPEQAETLRVADAVELNVATKSDRLVAATELRRLHGENETLKKCLLQMQNAAIELAEQEPFKPDWVSYRQGLADGAAQPEQEPVAWIYDWYGHKSAKEPRALVKDWIAAVYTEVSDPTIGAHNIRPLYTAPPRKPWQGLTDDEVDACFADHGWSSSAMYHMVVHAIEAKLKEKNNAV
jgi:hypothetical protein